MKTHIPLENLFFHSTPDAMAHIRGNEENPLLEGVISFYRCFVGGVLIHAEVFHLPDSAMPMSSGFFGLHIHESGNCTKPFDKTGNHYNPGNMPHPKHAGDLPPLLSNNGYSWMAFYDSRFTLPEIIGKSVVIHGSRDDFTSQPSGDAGVKIGCGVIKEL